MFKWASRQTPVRACFLLLAGGMVVESAMPDSDVGTMHYPGIGREATESETAAWDRDIRPDFLGAPLGKGNALHGKAVYLERCASCHGEDGRLKAFFIPLIGGTTPRDVVTGRVAALATGEYHGPPTTMMKLPSVSTILDYVQRAMPWDSPGSLAPNDLYAVTAYILYMAGVVPEDFELSNQSLAEVQAMLPNRNGMYTSYRLWPGDKPLDNKEDGSLEYFYQTDPCRSDCAVTGDSIPVKPELEMLQGDFRQHHRQHGPY